MGLYQLVLLSTLIVSQRIQLLLILIIVGAIPASPSFAMAADPDLSFAGLGPFEDCNDNGVPDQSESATHFSILLPGLIGSYGGLIGVAHASDYGFHQRFLLVRDAWLRIQGTADPYVEYGVDLVFDVRIDGAPWESAWFPDLDEYEICFPLAPPPDPSGSIALVIQIGACCDHISIVDAASLWFDAVPKPPAQDLHDFANLQNCFQSESSSQPCVESDIDWDDDVDLEDIRYFVQVFAGPE